MPHLHIDPTPESISLLLSSLFISLILIALLLIKCMRHNTNPSVSLINASTSTMSKILIDPTDEMSDFSNSTKPVANIIIDETILRELDTQSMPSDNKNASMMNLLQSHTRQSSFQNDIENSTSVSTENILTPSHAQKPHSASLTTPRDMSVKSLDSSIVLENVNSIQEKHQSSSVSRDNSPVPDYDEVKPTDPFRTIPSSSSNHLLLPNSPLKQSLSFESPSKKIPTETLTIQDPPELPARNARLASLQSNKRPLIHKPDTSTGTEEVYECIQDEFVQLEVDRDSSSPTKSDDRDDPVDSTYASVDPDKMKKFEGPPSLPAPRLPEHFKGSKDLAKQTLAQEKKNLKKTRNSFHETSDNNMLAPETTDTMDNARKKTKSFTPFTKIRPSKKLTSPDLTTSPNPTSPVEHSAEHNAKIARGALPPLPPTNYSDQDDNDEQYTCIETSSIQRHSRSSGSSSEDPYSELTFDPTKNKAPKLPIKSPNIDCIAVDYTQSDDSRTSPMEMDQPYSSIEELNVRVKKTFLQPQSIEEGTPNISPLSDSELPSRALPQPPTEPKSLVSHQYVRPEVIKLRKQEHRKTKEQERHKLQMERSSREEPPPQAESEQIIPSQQFPSLKSIFSDFRKEKDIVTENLSHVLGLPPPEPPNESDEETQSYASAAEVRERKAKNVKTSKPIPYSGLPDDYQVSENELYNLDIGDIGDHTYSSLIGTRFEANPYEEPNFVLNSFSPTYEDPEEIINIFSNEDPKSKISNEGSVDDDFLGYETLQFINERDPKISPKISQDLSKLREQKGYVKVSHNKENIPEYASIDDFQKEAIKAQKPEENSNNNINMDSPTNTLETENTFAPINLPDPEDKPSDEISKEDLRNSL